jgi:hypothetical protein
MECDYTNTIKEVNKIFYSNYGGKPKKTATGELSGFLKVPLAIFMFLSIILCFYP